MSSCYDSLECESYSHDLEANPPNQVCVAAQWSSTLVLAAGSGSASSASNRLNAPADVSIDGNGYLYVVDNGNHRIQRFPPGQFVVFCLDYRFQNQVILLFYHV